MARTTRTDAPATAHVRELDWLMLAVVGLCCLGLVMAVSVLGTDPRLGPVPAVKKQGIELLTAMVGFFVAALVPMALVRRLALPGFVVCAGLCYAARFVAEPWNGAYRWIQLGRFQFQPVEAARFCLVILAAHLLAAAGRDISTFRRGFLPPMLAVAFLVGALLLQPDHGSALLAATLVACMALVAGVRIRHFVPWCLAGLAGMAALALRHDYVNDRLLGFLNVAPRTQVGQSLVAIASGGTLGRGLGQGWMKMGFVPEAENDFIFAVVAEELGYVGSLLVLVLYSVLGVMSYRLVCRIKDPFLRFVVCGFALMLLMQASVNLLVVSGWAPAKGIDLPFVSTGGTSLFFCLAAVGLIGNAARTDLQRAGSPRSNQPGRV
ncbi:MAG: FtsW/RodA/SpoVE family cell cycle protein [Planctomycetota bacterium]